MHQLPIHILLADDNEAFVELIADQLSSEYGYVTHVVYDGQAAKEALADPKAAYSLVIADYAMPKATGLDLLRWMGEKEMKTPVIIVTGAGSEPVAVEAMKLGAYDYLRKEELDMRRLDTTIHSTLERRRARAAEELEGNRLQETSLNEVATDHMRVILAGVAPVLTSAFVDLQTGFDRLQTTLRNEEKNEKGLTEAIVNQLRNDSATLQAGLKILLSLYSYSYSHHSHLRQLEDLEKSMQKQQRGE